MTIIIIFLIIWLGAMGAWWALSSAVRSNDVDRLRNRILDTPDKKVEKKAKAAGIPRLINSEEVKSRLAAEILKKFDLQKKLNTLLEQAGLKWRPAAVVHGCLGLFLGGFFVARIVFSIPSLVAQLAIGAVFGLMPVFYIMRVMKKRMHKFEEQFPESLEFVSRSMRAGHAFSVALEMLHREFQEPLSGEFRRTFDEHNLGLPLDQALLKLAGRVPILDVHFFVSAVLLQKRTGGNLAEILDKLAYVIRERFKLRGKIRAISAHGRMTGLALTLIPVAVAVMMFYTNPSYISFFIEDEIGNFMMAAAITLQLIGYLIIRKIVNIEV